MQEKKIIKLSLSISGELSFGTDPDKMFAGDVELNYRKTFLDVTLL